jgi:protein ImuB
MFSAIFIPNFSLQAMLRHEPDLRERAVALVDPAMPKSVIIQLTSAARSYGVCEGLTSSQAMARCAELIIKARSLAQEESATEVLLQTAYAFSPNIEFTAPGVCTMELKGLPFQSRSDAAGQWGEKIVEVLAQFYIETQIGFAATPELALLAARAAKPILALKNGAHGVTRPTTPEEAHEQRAVASSLESFPVSSLEPALEILEILRRWGIRTVGELLALGKDATAERLGPVVVELFNRISPDSPRPLKLVVPPEEFAEQMDFEHEIETTEPLLFALRRFVEQLSRRLELIYLVVAEFHLRLGLSSGAKYERLFKIPSPTGNIDILFRMLQTHLETVQTDSPITSLRLVAKPAKPEAQQFGLFESTLRDPNQFAETLARLTALVGSENIGTPELVTSHKPDSFRMGVPEFGSQTERDIYTALTHAVQRAQRSSETTSIRSPKRPEDRAPKQPIFHERTGLQLRRFRPALASHIEFREGAPSLLRSPVFIGPIVETRGPFFSSGNWWDAGRWAREEWDVETSDGSLFRIFCSNDGCFVEGVYD